MASLREMLDKQKQEKLNAASKEIRAASLRTEAGESKPEIPAVSQAGTEAQTIISGPSEPGNPGKILTGNLSGNGSIGGQEIAAVPPAGLSGLALLKWKKEHATKIPKTPTVDPAPTLPRDIEQTNSNGLDKLQDGNNNVQDTNAIGHRDAEKTNDGVVDAEALRNNLIYLANNITQKELVGQVVRTIAVQLKQNPELCSFMQKSDVDLIVRGCRMAYQIAARKKAEKADTKVKKTAVDEGLGRMFKDAGLDIGKLNFS